jgi:hypothetical protein
LFFGGFSPVCNPFFCRSVKIEFFLVFFNGHILKIIFFLKRPQIQYWVPIGTQPNRELSQCFYLYITV